MKTYLTPEQETFIKQTEAQTEFSGEIEIQELVQKWFHRLNDTFYFDALKGTVESILEATNCSESDPASNPDMNPTMVVRGVFFNRFTNPLHTRTIRTPSKLTPHGGNPTIILYAKRLQHISTSPLKISKEHLTQYIGTLVHELLHAFLTIYSCICFDLCDFIVLSLSTGSGFTGHGLKFCLAMECIEATLNRDLNMGTEISCGINNAILVEMFTTGWLPGRSLWGRWGLSIGKISGTQMLWSQFAIRGVDTTSVLYKRGKAEYLLSDVYMIGKAEAVKAHELRLAKEKDAGKSAASVSLSLIFTALVGVGLTGFMAE